MICTAQIFRTTNARTRFGRSIICPGIITSEQDVNRAGNERRRQRHVGVGDVKAEEPLVSMESDKATISSRSGFYLGQNARPATTFGVVPPPTSPTLIVVPVA
jgi:hypothetical protein